MDRTFERRVSLFLLALLLFDCTLTLWAWAFPELWFETFHGVKVHDPQALLSRMGGNWAAFALFQGIALVRWKREPFWLLVVAGVRLSDIFTDLTYIARADDTTWFAHATLWGMGPINALMGWALIRAWRRMPVRS